MTASSSSSSCCATVVHSDICPSRCFAQVAAPPNTPLWGKAHQHCCYSQTPTSLTVGVSQAENPSCAHKLQAAGFVCNLAPGCARTFWSSRARRTGFRPPGTHMSTPVQSNLLYAPCMEAARYGVKSMLQRRLFALTFQHLVHAQLTERRACLAARSVHSVALLLEHLAELRACAP